MSIKFTQIKKELDVSDTMPFGKYQGLTIARVIVDDLRYIKWMMENSEQFFVSDKVHELIQVKEYEKHLKDCSYNNYVVDYDIGGTFGDFDPNEDIPF